MLRCISFILLLALLPRMLFATPDGSIVCFANDHVAVDCHQAVDESQCYELPSSLSLGGAASDPVDDGVCLDVAAVSIDAQASNSTTGLELAKFLTTLVPALIGVLELTPATQISVATFDDPPHSFCARTFCCSIALRC
jgi:hypothetical protein